MGINPIGRRVFTGGTFSMKQLNNKANRFDVLYLMHLKSALLLLTLTT
ncbi:hypothetical protein yfred0001_2220 [Yersinia frederiksenii ATCC 33641]|nr:hypothetical protein yfred0001_2220 [Yersinia frederiksenii ATCC 33641]